MYRVNVSKFRPDIIPLSTGAHLLFLRHSDTWLLLDIQVSTYNVGHIEGITMFY